jgi:hypothetical protein
MAERMPTSLELKNAFGGKGVVGQTRTVFAVLRDEEARGRNLREAQVQDNCSFQWTQLATFDSAAAGGQLITDWIEFGTLRFTEKPVFVSGSEWIPQDGEQPVNQERTNLDTSTHLVVPGGAQVVGWKTDQRGCYQAAKLVLFCYGAVPEGYRIYIHGLWVGPAIRKA